MAVFLLHCFFNYKPKDDNSQFEYVYLQYLISSATTRVSVQGVKSLGGPFTCLCRGFEFYGVKKNFLLLFFKKKMEILLHF